MATPMKPIDAVSPDTNTTADGHSVATPTEPVGAHSLVSTDANTTPRVHLVATGSDPSEASIVGPIVAVLLIFAIIAVLTALAIVAIKRYDINFALLMSKFRTIWKKEVSQENVDKEEKGSYNYT